MCNASWDWTSPEVERSYQIWQPFHKRQFARTDGRHLIVGLDIGIRLRILALLYRHLHWSTDIFIDLRTLKIGRLRTNIPVL